MSLMVAALCAVNTLCCGVRVDAATVTYDTVYSVRVLADPAHALVSTPLLLSDGAIGISHSTGYPESPGQYGPASGHGEAYSGYSLQSALATYAGLYVGPRPGSTGVVGIQSNAYWRDYAIVDGTAPSAPLRLWFDVHALLDVAGEGFSRIRIFGGAGDSRSVDSTVRDYGADSIAFLGQWNGIQAYYNSVNVNATRTPELIASPPGSSWAGMTVHKVSSSDDPRILTAKNVTVTVYMDTPLTASGAYPFSIGLSSDARVPWSVTGGSALSNALSTVSFTGATNALTGEAVPVTFGSGITHAPANGPVVPEPSSLALAAFALIAGIGRRFRSIPSID